MSETDKTRLSIPLNREFWLVSRLRKAQEEDVILFRVFHLSKVIHTRTTILLNLI